MKRKYYLIILLVILIVLILLIRVRTEKQYWDHVVDPYERTEYYKTTEVSLGENCTQIPLSYNSNWLDWQPEINGFISPTLYFQNNDSQTGTYSIQFYFFNEDVYEYDIFRDTMFDLFKQSVGDRAAEMKSPILNLTLSPGENTNISIYTKKTRLQDTYWAYANIITPSKKICFDNPYNISVFRNRSVIRLQDFEVERTISIRIPLWKYLWRLLQ